LKRRIVAALVIAVAAAAAAITVVVLHDGGSKAVATVSGHKISSEDLDLAVEHFHEEADAEGRPFPARGTKEYERVKKLALRLLIDRAAIEAAAAKLGVHVSEAQVEARVGANAGEEEGGDVRAEADDAFRRATARTQLIEEAVSRKLTANIAVRPSEARAYYRAHRSLYGKTPFASVAGAIRSQLLSGRKNAVLARWLAGVRRSEPRA
jgi:hypothetical protein